MRDSFTSRDFALVRQGVKIGGKNLVITVNKTDDPTKIAPVPTKRVGNSVVRHRFARQIREILREELSETSENFMVSVLVLPAANELDFARLKSELVSQLNRAFKKLQ